jgi:very-short-patch-repair endonuclease
VSRLDEDDRGAREGIPVTSVARTLLDLAAILPLDGLRRAFEQAERMRLLDVRALYAARGRSPRRHGLRALNLLLAEGREPWETRSELERQFVEVCREANLPMPTLNALVAGYEVDAVWMCRRLVVELDGYAFHRTRAAFERDRARDGDLQLAGYRVMRITARRLERDQGEVVAALRVLLGPYGSSEPPRPSPSQ